MNIEPIVLHDASFDTTLGASTLLGKRVLSKSGLVVGHVSELSLDVEKMKLEGIVVKGSYKRSLYIGRSYIEKLTAQAIMLKIDPSVLLIGKRVISYEGKVLGRVLHVARKADTNEIDQLVVHSFLKRDSVLPAHALGVIGKSVILEKSYDVRRNYIWQKA